MPAKTHGMSHTKEYKLWSNVITRCTRPSHQNYSNYGGRGIKICNEWRTSFETFFAYIGKIPSSSHTLDRIDNNKNYEPGNVRWATKAQQANNTRANILITFKNKTQTATAWAKDLGLRRGYEITRRLERGWPLERALSNTNE